MPESIPDALSYGPVLVLVGRLFAAVVVLLVLWAALNWRRSSEAPAPMLEPERTARDGWQALHAKARGQTGYELTEQGRAALTSEPWRPWETL